MTVLPKDQIDKMAQVMDDILKYPNLSIGELRKRYNLTVEEFDMIYDLCMPLIRETNVKRYWAVKAHYYIRKMKEYLARKDLNDAEFRKRIRRLAYDKSSSEPYMFTATGLEDMLASAEE